MPLSNLGRFFVVSGLHATCTKCGVSLKVQERSSFNLKKHYRVKHAADEDDLLEAIAEGRRKSGGGGGRTAIHQLQHRTMEDSAPPDLDDDEEDHETAAPRLDLGLRVKTTSDCKVTAVSPGDAATPTAIPQDCDMDSNGSLPHLRPFFKISDMKASCTKCGSVLKMQERTVFNLKKHYKAKHAKFEKFLLAAIADGSKRGKKAHTLGQQRRPEAVDVVKKRNGGVAAAGAGPLKDGDGGRFRFDQTEAEELLSRFFVSDLVPLEVADSEAFRRFLACLCPEFEVPSRDRLAESVRIMVERTKANLRSVLAKQEFVATTLDGWSCRRRSLVGMTVTWLDQKTLERFSAVLGVKEYQEALTGGLAIEAVHELHQEFGIDKKVVKTTVDGGGGAGWVIGQGDHEDSSTIVRHVPILESLERTCRVPHMAGGFQRCAAHTVNSLAVYDTEGVPGWTCDPNPAFSRPSSVASSLWELQNSRVEAAADICAAIGWRLATPVASNWSSTHSAYKHLLSEASDPEKLLKLNRICLAQQPHPLPPILADDLGAWSDYVKVTAPLAACLEKLQAEDKRYMGCLLPTLRKLKDSLILLSRSDAISTGAKNLVSHLLHQVAEDVEPSGGFEKRFNHLFRDMDLLMATAMHPHYKPIVVSYLCQGSDTVQSINNRIVQEIVEKVNQLGLEAPDGKEGADLDEDTDCTWPCAQAGKLAADMAKRIRGELARWSLVRVPTKERLSHQHFPREFREAWVAVFSRYNTPLPSSVSDLWTDILPRSEASPAPPQSILGLPSFEVLSFLRSNLGLAEPAADPGEEDLRR